MRLTQAILDIRNSLNPAYFNWLKWLITIGLLLFIIGQVEWDQFYLIFQRLTLLQVGAILILSSFSLLAQYDRWRYLISKNSINFEARHLLPSFFAGFSLRLMLPGGHAEVGKVFLLPGKKSGKMVAYTIEKFFQYFIKILLVMLVLPLTFPQYRRISWLVVGILFGLYLFLPRFVWLRKFQETTVNNHTLFARTLMYTLVVYVVMVIEYYLLLQNLYPISMLDTAHVVIYLWAAGVVPISVAGLGVREGLAVYFFGLQGLAAAPVVATSLFVFTLNNVAPALIGLYFLNRQR